MLRHLGRREGAGASWTGVMSVGVAGVAGCGDTDVAGWETAHDVQVEVEETRTVESEKVVSTLVSEPDVTVAVTGHVVIEVETLGSALVPHLAEVGLGTHTTVTRLA